MRKFALLLTAWMALTGAAMAQTITFTPQGGVQTFAVRPPVLRVKPGDIVESPTFSRPGDYYEKEGGRVAGRGRAVLRRGRDARRHAGRAGS